MKDKSFQSALPEAMYVYPVDSSVELPSRWTQYAPAAKSIIGEKLDIDGKREQWLGDFNWVFDVAP
jgi:thiamine transport system substrate-binding protein